MENPIVAPNITVPGMPYVYIPVYPVYYNYTNVKPIAMQTNIVPAVVSQENSTLSSASNFNTIVDGILSTTRKNNKRTFCKKKKDTVKSSRTSKKKRKNAEQIKILMDRTDREWTKEDVLDISTKTGLTQTQVYKWRWDNSHK